MRVDVEAIVKTEVEIRRLLTGGRSGLPALANPKPLMRPGLAGTQVARCPSTASRTIHFMYWNETIYRLA